MALTRRKPCWSAQVIATVFFATVPRLRSVDPRSKGCSASDWPRALGHDDARLKDELRQALPQHPRHADHQGPRQLLLLRIGLGATETNAARNDAGRLYALDTRQTKYLEAGSLCPVPALLELVVSGDLPPPARRGPSSGRRSAWRGRPCRPGQRGSRARRKNRSSRKPGSTSRMPAAPRGSRRGPGPRRAAGRGPGGPRSRPRRSGPAPPRPGRRPGPRPCRR